MNLLELPSDLKSLWEDRRKNRALRKYRAAILRRHYTELFNIVHIDQIGGYFDIEHVKKLLLTADKMRVLIFSRQKFISSQIAELLKAGNVEFRFFPEFVYNIRTEMLIGDNEVFISDGTIHNVIDNPRYAADMRILFNGLWEIAETLPKTWFTLAK